jgi:hypothetical protein
MRVHLETALKSKYANLRVGFATGIDVSEDFVQSWMSVRDGTYLSAENPGAIVPLLELLKDVGVTREELRVRLHSKDHFGGDTLLLKAQICKDFQFVWNQVPTFWPGDFVHGARTNAYLVYPGVEPGVEISGPAFASTRGLDALLFAAATYSRVMENCNATA